MKLLLYLSLTFFIFQLANAQDQYVFKVDSVFFPEVTENDYQELPYLSKEVSVKFEQFTRLYTRKIDCGPPEHISSIEIDKPYLYYSIKKLSKYYFKGLKKGVFEKDIAEKELKLILSKCMAIHSKETYPIEQELKAASNPKEILSIFSKIVVE